MNELLQKHGCSNVFTIPDGLRELMSDISREVLREQPSKICDFIANYLSALLVTREHGILAVKILEDLCDCKPTVSEHLLQLGFERDEAEALAEVIKAEIEGFEPTEGKEKVRESELLKKILHRNPLDEEMTARVCQVARNAYRDYWYRKKLLEQGLKMQPEEPWEIAAQNTLELYKRTKPSFAELTRATQKIQAAYRGYFVRKSMLKHISPKPKKVGPRVELSGPPVDTAASREIDLGPVIDIKGRVREDDMKGMFDDHVGETLGLKYDPMKTITHVDDQTDSEYPERRQSRMMQVKGAKSDDFHEKSASAAASTISHVSGVEQLELEPEPKMSFAQRAPFPEDKVPADVRIIPSQSKSEPSQLAAMSKVDTVSQVKSATSRIEVQEHLEADVLPVQIKSVTSQKSHVTTIDTIDEDQEEIPIEVIQEPPAAEVPEDLDDQTEPDSAPTASVPSSAPMSAATTDVEDTGLTTEDEG